MTPPRQARRCAPFGSTTYSPSIRNDDFTLRRVSSELSSWPPVAKDSMRPTRFTFVPTAAYFVRRGEPMFPTITGPDRGKENRGHRPRAHPVPEVCRTPWRPDLGEEPGGRRLDVHVLTTQTGWRMSWEVLASQFEIVIAGSPGDVDRSTRAGRTASRPAGSRARWRRRTTARRRRCPRGGPALRRAG